MVSINTYIAEFVAVVSHCMSRQLGRQIIRNRYAIDKPSLEALLDQNKYEESAAKLQVWKALRWIDADEGRDTLSIYNPSGKGQKRMVVINLTVHQKLQEFVK